MKLISRTFKTHHLKLKTQNVLLALLFVLAAAAGVTAQTVDPAARKLVTTSAEAHAKLTDFTATVEMKASAIAVPDSTVVIESRGGKSLRVRITTREGEWIGVRNNDGVFTRSSKDPGTYAKYSLEDTEPTVRDLYLLSGVRGLVGCSAMFSGLDLVDLFADNIESIKFGKPETIGDTAVEIVVIGLEQPTGSLTLAIGKQDHLVRRVVYEIRSKERPASSFTETVKAFDAKARIGDDVFAFTPPEGAKLFEPEPPPAMYDKALKPGAAPILFTVNDLTGKPLTLADYKGKVVLVDFWATWCPPCREEIPNVVSAFEKFKGQGFEVVSISLDEEDGRAKLDAFIRKNKMNWRHVFDGKGWGAEVAKLYGIRAIPFMMLVGRDGKIAAVNVRGELLEPAIKAALDAK